MAQKGYQVDFSKIRAAYPGLDEKQEYVCVPILPYFYKVCIVIFSNVDRDITIIGKLSFSSSINFIQFLGRELMTDIFDFEMFGIWITQPGGESSGFKVDEKNICSYDFFEFLLRSSWAILEYKFICLHLIDYNG